jgi:hypothetical protein
MTRAAKIATIHEERAGNVKVAEHMGTYLSQVAAALDNVEQVRRELLGRVEDDARERLAGWSVSIKELAENVQTERLALDQALTRLRRQALNIGMVGRARQGKSRFLQSLTGLTTREIPDGASGFCTGVPSVVQHVAGSETSADVFFHTSTSFLRDVISPYYERLNFGAPPASLDQFSRNALPALPPGSSADHETAYGHLATYHSTFGEYGNLLGETSPRRISGAEIRGYVAQTDEAGRRSNTFRAVRRVQITTSFPKSDLSGIGVIDLPGLGDTNLGDSQVMLSALKDDVDIVLFLRRPAPEGDGIHDYDIGLYGIATLSLPEVPMERRSFMILNHRKSADQDNLARCEEFRDQLSGSAIRVVKTAIADCSSADEVSDAFDPVVDYLIGHIGELDRLLLTERKRRSAEIQQEVRLLIRQLGSLGVYAQPVSTWFPVFNGLFDVTYRNLSVGIEGLVRKYNRERGRADDAFAREIDLTLQRAAQDTGIPTPEEIEREIDFYGGFVAAYAHLLDRTRSHMSKHFLGLDGALRGCVEQMWTEVAEVLREAGDLKAITDKEGIDFLLAFTDRIPPVVSADGTSNVRFALEILTQFDMSYRGFIQHRIRSCLDGLDPNTPRIRFTAEMVPDGVRIHEALSVNYDETLFECRRVLQNLQTEPHEAVFGIVEEFKDRVLRVAGIDSEWRAIYEDLRAEIWADRFAALAERAAHMRAWNEAVEQLAGHLGQEA